MLGLCALTAEGAGSIPGQGTEIPQAEQHGQKKKSHAVKKSCSPGHSRGENYMSGGRDHRAASADVFQCVDTAQLLYPFIWLWTFWVVSSLGLLQTEFLYTFVWLYIFISLE